MPFVDNSRQLTANCFMCMDRKILIVDDEVDIREILQFNLENAGFNVECAASAEDALEMLTDKDVWPIPTYGDLLFEV